MRKFYAQSRLWSDALDVGIMEYKAGLDGKYQGFVARISLEPHEEGDEILEPTMRLAATEAQQLMDALWWAGIRPSNGNGNAGQLGATEKHLEDMRKLVFKDAPR